MLSEDQEDATIPHARTLFYDLGFAVNVQCRRMICCGAASVWYRLHPRDVKERIYGSAAPGIPPDLACARIREFLTTPDCDLTPLLVKFKNKYSWGC